VSEEAIMLWACRLAADEFYDLINVDITLGENKLHNRILDIRPNLRYGFNQNLTIQVFLGLLLVSNLKEWALPGGGVDVFKEESFTNYGDIIDTDWVRRDFDGLNGASFGMLYNLLEENKQLVHFKQALKLDWENHNKTNMSVYPLLSNLDEVTLLQAARVFNEELPSNLDRIEALSKAFKHIKLRNGFGLSSDPMWLLKNWESARHYAINLFDFCVNYFNNDLKLLREIRTEITKFIRI
jgi:hypothetical protein